MATAFAMKSTRTQNEMFIAFLNKGKPYALGKDSRTYLMCCKHSFLGLRLARILISRLATELEYLTDLASKAKPDGNISWNELNINF